MVAPAPRVMFPATPYGRTRRRRRSSQSRKRKGPERKPGPSGRRSKFFIAVGVLLAFYAILAAALGGLWPWYGMILLGGVGVAAIVLGITDLMPAEEKPRKNRREGRG